VRRGLSWLALGALVACGGKLFSIRISESSTVTVPEAMLVETLIGDLGFDDFSSLDLTQSEELQNQGVAPGDIEETFLVAFSLEALAPDGADLAFVEHFDVFVEAPDLPRARIASQDDFPAGEALVEFVLEDVDLTDYLVSRSMTLTTEVRGRRPEQATDVEAAFTLRVGVTARGTLNRL